MKKTGLALLLLCTLLMPSHTASAHVLITDKTAAKGAILHIAPDDDPIAGQEAMLYLDTQDTVSNSTVTVSIRDKNGIVSKKEMKIDRSLATTSYIFPAQGTYQLVFHVTSNKQTHTFTQTQRVARGLTASALNKPTYLWAEITLLICGVLFFLLLLTAFQRRRYIAHQSRP